MDGTIAPPEPNLTPAEMLRRAEELRPFLREHQAECEAGGQVPKATNRKLIEAGFYRIVQPRRFGGYEFDIPTFYKVMMEVSRGCTESGWVLALTAGHTILLAHFPEEAQRDAYGMDGEFRCPAAFSPPGRADPVEGGYRLSGGWVSASGCDLGTHFIGLALIPGDPPTSIQMLLERDQFHIVDDWHVMGMQGTGSRKVVAEDVFLPAHRLVEVGGSSRGSEAVTTHHIHPNPLYHGPIGPFLIGEATAVAVGTARGALDHYEEVLRKRRSPLPPHAERVKDPLVQRNYGMALALVATAEAALIQAGEEYMARSTAEMAGGEPFGEEAEQRLTLIEQQCVQLAWQAVELIYRTAGTTASAREGTPIGRALRNLAVITTHPALQMDTTSVAAACARFGLPRPPRL